jgi:DNA-binding CsgD family transcriptional regulator
MTGNAVKQAFDFLLDVSAIAEPEALVRTVVEGLPRLIASDVTTLSICDIPAGTRKVVGIPRAAIGAEEQACFNRLIHEHPLVRFHSTQAHGGAQRISDCVPDTQFRNTAVYSEYYARVGLDRVIALPVVASPRLVMSFVLNRKGRDFSDAERDLLDRLRPALANLYRFAKLDAEASAAGVPEGARLTPREEEVLRWVRGGKTDREIAAIVGASVRTVQKHLANAYVKLGVENRTAAAMRYEAIRRRAIC